ncbi:putative carboxylesterase 12 [Prunus yedoensis var. nudiflora]|uniref:Putative carboxylesterase 12 n=1 Tax=Prunus yedoensis var. nudiflora TaxID=2094558 RepID=A0A314ZNI2_PRUYE|nr:putative carboxylesterase 12 [Prunus yedoensis var. nudiflora]
MPPHQISHSSSRPSSESTKTAASKDLKAPKSSRPDPETGVRSKDIVLSLESGLSARIFLPKLPDPTQKLPLLVFIHGGAFVIEFPYSPLYHSHVALLTSEANVVVLSVHYRRAPEHPLPVAYEDSWEALQWAAAHSNRNGPETWLNDYVDFDHVFVGGDSAGATLTNHMVHRAGVHRLSGAKIVGMILLHPYFGNEKPNKLLEVIFPACSGLNDPRMNPGKDPKLGRLGVGGCWFLWLRRTFSGTGLGLTMKH